MQTFVPHTTYRECARVLDRQRLGKQRVEVLQLAGAILGGGGWSKHACTKMWRGHGAALIAYGMVICEEWSARGYRDNCLPKMVQLYQDMLAAGESSKLPPWWGRPDVHHSHQANLVRKSPEHYSSLFPGVEPMDGYVWPVTTPDLTDEPEGGSVPGVAAGRTRTPHTRTKEPTVAARARKTAKQTAPAEPEDLDLDDVEADETEDDTPAPAKPKRSKAKGPKAKDTADAEVADDPKPAKAAKGSKSGIEAAQAARAANAPKFGTKELAAHVNDKLGTSYTPYQLRAILRRMARDEDSSLERTVGETRERYSFTGPKDPQVKELIKRLQAGEIEADKKEQLDKLKERTAGKKGGKKAKQPEPEPEVEDLDDDEDLEEDDTDEEDDDE